MSLIGKNVKNIANFTCDAYQKTSSDSSQENIIKINLASYLEKSKWVVLLFYPADFTFICPTELREASNLYKNFKENDAEILSISTDTVFTHKAWHDSSDAISGITFPMIADPTGALCKAFDTYIDEEGLSLRSSVIIDPDGKIVSYEIHDNSIGRNVEEILRKLQASKFVYDNDGVEVCPVNWKPGGKTLKPGLDLVGKI